MSRVYENCGEWDNDQDERDFLREVKAEYKNAAPDLAGFLKFLDAMEPKRIIADRFFKPRTGEVCAVAAFCRFKGFDDAKMREFAVLSAEQRREYDGTEAEWDEAATVQAGMSAGLPVYVAQDLVWRNDESWDQVFLGDGPCDCGYHQSHGMYRAMTPEERWFKLRNFVAKKVGKKPIVEPAALQTSP